jgi:hypothetical protein
MKGGHHLAGEAAHSYNFSNWIFDAEQLFPNRSPSHANVSRSIRVILREYGFLITLLFTHTGRRLIR